MVRRVGLVCVLVGFTLVTGCNNANVTVSGLKKLIVFQLPKGTPGFDFLPGKAQVTNGSFTISGQIVGYQGSTVSNGPYTIYGAIAK